MILEYKFQFVFIYSAFEFLRPQRKVNRTFAASTCLTYQTLKWIVDKTNPYKLAFGMFLEYLAKWMCSYELLGIFYNSAITV